MEECWNCKFFIYREPLGPNPVEGFCRRHAPPPADWAGVSRWPVALNTDWCGEYVVLPVVPQQLTEKP